MKDKPKGKNTLLLPVDGSKRCLETVRYASRFEPFRSMKIVLFHVFVDVPDCYYDLEREPKSVKAVRHVRAWVNEKKKEMQLYMDGARQILVRAGFPKDDVAVRIQGRKQGVARDILKEAKKGYAAVVLRRRGATGLRNLIMGSVAAKLMEKLAFVPLIIVGREPVTHRALVAVDGSEGARHAVDFAARTLAGSGFSIHLVNVIRGMEAAGPEGEAESAGGPFCARDEIVPVLEAAARRMVDSGFAKDRISWSVITGALSRAGAITEEAAKENCETIIVGRKGLSGVKDFFIGRVSSKVVQLARRRTVWVVT